MGGDIPLVLSFDTSGPYCAAALSKGAKVLTTSAEPMTRGQAERLMPMLQEILADHGLHWHDLDAIGVGTGPGNFTGIRIAVSAARGLALGLNKPAYGVNGFDARTQASEKQGLATVPAPREQVYLRDAQGTDTLLHREDAVQQARAAGIDLLDEPTPDALSAAICAVVMTRWPDVPQPPAPTYVRAADAAPSSDVPPVLLDP